MKIAVLGLVLGSVLTIVVNVTGCKSSATKTETLTPTPLNSEAKPTSIPANLGAASGGRSR